MLPETILWRYKMSTTLKNAIDFAKQFPSQEKISKKNISKELLGKYHDVIPSEMTSTEFIKNLRNTLYDKVK
jgi:hypothetical protein